MQVRTSRPWATAVRGLLLLLLFLAAAVRPAAGAPTPPSCTYPVLVANAADLTTAITCFNSEVAPATYEITLTADIPLNVSPPTISNSTPDAELLLDGAGFAVDGQEIDGIQPFVVAANTTVTIQNLTITRVRLYNSSGAILNYGTLLLDRSTLTDNVAIYGAGIYNGGDMRVANSTISGSFADAGAAIFNSNSVLVVVNSTISGNTAFDDGGGIYNSNATATVRNSTLAGNQAVVFSGGGVYNASGSLWLLNSIIADSADGGDCTRAGGAVFAQNSLIEDGLTCVSVPLGGNLTGNPALGTLQDKGGPTLTHPLLAGSPARDAGDNTLALALDGVTPLAADQRGPGFPRIFNSTVDMGAYEYQTSCAFPAVATDEDTLSSAIDCFNQEIVAGEYLLALAADIPLTQSTITIDNAAAGVALRIDGAGLTVDGQDISGVRPFTIEDGTTVTMQNLTVTGGNATGSGGAVHNAGELAVVGSSFSGNAASINGGGIYNETSAVLAISSSTVSGNEADFNGGGIYNETSAVLAVSNSTVSGNTADYGGGISSGGSLVLRNSTLSGNVQNSSPSGALDGFGGTLTLNNSIVANSSGGGSDCYNYNTTFNAANSLIESDLDCVTGASANNLSGDPLLGPLQDNGGPAETHALLPGSPAANAGSNALALAVDGSTPLTTDQRGPGFPRFIDATVDMGAFEQDCTSPQVVAGVAQLNHAIACFNAEDTAGLYEITLAADILLAASTTDIENSTAGLALHINGAGFAVDGQDNVGVRPFSILFPTTVTIEDIVITGGSRDGAGSGGDPLISGGGIYNAGSLTVARSEISGNAASSGGGIYNADTLTLTDSMVSGNEASFGGGIFSAGHLSIIASTISGGTASFGGGLYHTGSGHILGLHNSTVSANEASGSGGGLYLSNGTLPQITFSTLSGNAAANGSSIFTYDSVTIDSAIMADSPGEVPECEIGGGVASVTNTLVEDGSCGITNGVDGNLTGDPALGPLQDNGGPTPTHMPGSGSAADDAGDNTACATVPVSNLDQRGVPRPQDSTCDMGAVEITAQATLYGFVALQGRTQPGTPGTVTISDLAAALPDNTVPFDAVTGAFSFGSVPVAAGGTDYDVTAVHSLYLANRRAPAAVPPAANLNLATTTLRGGDANNSGVINILDLGCMGGAYNTPGSTCGGTGGTDINNDGITNIQDLAIAGGNYNLTAPRPW